MTTPPSDRRHTPLDADTLLVLLDEVNAELPEGSTAESQPSSLLHGMMTLTMPSAWLRRQVSPTPRGCSNY
ncbi:MAG: hypothetical protein OXG52_09920 [bacterium]|nr:hypothetical protein [bacterium]